MFFWPTDALDENDDEYCPVGMIYQKYSSAEGVSPVVFINWYFLRSC